MYLFIVKCIRYLLHTHFKVSLNILLIATNNILWYHSTHDITVFIRYKGLVCPLFKKGDRKDPSSYRPVSLTSESSKVTEHVILQ